MKLHRFALALSTMLLSQCIYADDQAGFQAFAQANPSTSYNSDASPLSYPTTNQKQIQTNSAAGSSQTTIIDENGNLKIKQPSSPPNMKRSVQPQVNSENPPPSPEGMTTPGMMQSSPSIPATPPTAAPEPPMTPPGSTTTTPGSTTTNNQTLPSQPNSNNNQTNTAQ